MTFTCTVEKPACFCAVTFAARNASNSDRSPFGEPYDAGTAGAFASSSWMKRRGCGSKSRSATQSPFSSSSTWLRSSSIPNLSTNTLMRARARFTRSQSWRSKMRKTASATLRYSPLSASTNS